MRKGPSMIFQYPSTLAKLSLVLVLFSLQACQTAYYNAWEKLGVEKRDLLVDRVEDARDAQEDAQEQFSSALEAFSALVEFDGGELEKMYNSLNSEYDDSADAAEKVSDRIDRIDSVANALFKEWENELSEFSNPRYKADSQKQLRDTESRYQNLQKSLRNAEASMQPVLATMKDNVLRLKHMLNTNAIGSLDSEYQIIKRDIDKLINEMNDAIERSNQFIASMKS